MGEIVPSVTALMAYRSLSHSQPEKRDDPFTLALVCEGGGTRGVVTAGMATALAALGLTSCFDQVHGSSSGACNVAFLLTGQEAEGTSVYYRDLQENFRDFRRYFTRKGPLINIAHLADVFRTKVVLDNSRLADSPIKAHFYTTDALTGERVVLTNRDNTRDHVQSLHKSCKIPYWAGPPLEDEDGLFSDGSVSTGGIPYFDALEAGATHALVALSRPQGALKLMGPEDRFAYFRLLRQGHITLAQRYKDSFRDYNKTLIAAWEAEQNEDQLPQVEVLQLRDFKFKIAAQETDPRILHTGAHMGFIATLEHFDSLGLTPNPDKLILPY
jgi:predicted patatin/cPLA2 family phospholipase